MLSYFLADDTLSIFEPPQRNTGITGGKYLERSKVPCMTLMLRLVKVISCQMHDPDAALFQSDLLPIACMNNE